MMEFSCRAASTPSLDPPSLDGASLTALFSGNMPPSIFGGNVPSSIFSENVSSPMLSVSNPTSMLNGPPTPLNDTSPSSDNIESGVSSVAGHIPVKGGVVTSAQSQDTNTATSRTLLSSVDSVTSAQSQDTNTATSRTLLSSVDSISSKKTADLKPSQLEGKGFNSAQKFKKLPKQRRL